jgi:tetratricopeptide (TPR) repeat protein
MKTKSLLLVIAAILFALAARAQAPSQNEKAAAINALIQQANNAMNAKNWEGAIAPLQELLTLDPAQWQFYATLGDAQLNLEEFDEAVESYEKGIHAAESNTVVDPRNPSTDPTKKKAGVAKMLANQGSAYVKLHKNMEAFSVFTKAAALDPNPAVAYFNLCATAYIQGIMQGAVAACDKVIAADPSKADAYFIKGSALFGEIVIDKDGTVKALPGTVEALKKYLALAPTGAHVDDVKKMLEAVGSKVAVGTRSHAHEENAPSAESPEKVDYTAALNTQDPEKRAAALESFATRYPESVVRVGALEQAMKAYQQTGNGNKVVETARLLAMDRNWIGALDVVSSDFDRGGSKKGCADVETGLMQLPSWPKPEGMSDSEFGERRDEMVVIFTRMKGECAFLAQDYPAARAAFTKVFQIQPTNWQNAMSLAMTDLRMMTPPDLNGLWYCGKAITQARQQNLARAEGSAQACFESYRQYHGGDDGFDQMVDETAAENAPPPDFPSRITPGRTQPAWEQRPSSAQQNPRPESTGPTLAQSKPDAEKKGARYFVKIAANIASNVRLRGLNGYIAIYVDSQSWASGLKDSQLAPFLKLKGEKAGRCAVLFVSPDKDAAISVFFDGDSPFGVTAAKAGSSGQFEAGDISAAYKPVSKEMFKETGQEFQFNESQIVTDEGSPVVAFEVSTTSKKPAN